MMNIFKHGRAWFGFRKYVPMTATDRTTPLPCRSCDNFKNSSCSVEICQYVEKRKELV